MQTLKILIRGSYYDSQIYSGRLYLWHRGGSIITINWDRLIESVNVEERLKLALRCAFQQSEYLYSSDFQLIFQDEEIKRTLQKKFDDLQETSIEFSEIGLKKGNLVIAEQDTSLPFPHADSLIYNKTLYAGDVSGIWATTFNKRNKPINPQSTKLWDGPVLGISASYSTLALAAGSEGLYERPSSLYVEEEPHQLVNLHTNSARWMYFSIFSSSYFNSGYLADFTLEDLSFKERWGRAEDDEDRYEQLKSLRLKKRQLKEILPSDSIFSDQEEDLFINPEEDNISKYAWGVHDKFCLATQAYIDIVQYSPYHQARYERFKHLGRINTGGLHGDIIRGDSALFGFIVELDDGLLIFNSDGESSTLLSGEPVNWRIFPRSKYYTNQLHVIYEDYLCIYSFNQDYFVDQNKKRVGIRHSKAFSSGGFDAK